MINARCFRLDNTLIRCGHDFPSETPQLRILARLLSNEQLRYGIKALTDHCRQRGWEIWAYTTSCRSVQRIRRLFWHHGIRLDAVVNQQRHNLEARVRCTKYLPSFGIDLLVDDSEGVRIEGEQHGFRVLVVRPEDEQWTVKIKKV